MKIKTISATHVILMKWLTAGHIHYYLKEGIEWVNTLMNKN